jgi:hypothetical protein
MPQLTKDPMRDGAALPDTAHSPKRDLSGPMLERYLDYCGDMVSLVAKLAALIAQSCRDGAVSDAAGDVEALTAGLSRKIWRKIVLTPRGGSMAKAKIRRSARPRRVARAQGPAYIRAKGMGNCPTAVTGNRNWQGGRPRRAPRMGPDKSGLTCRKGEEAWLK